MGLVTGRTVGVKLFSCSCFGREDRSVSVLPLDLAILSLVFLSLSPSLGLVLGSWWKRKERTKSLCRAL